MGNKGGSGRRRKKRTRGGGKKKREEVGKLFQRELDFFFDSLQTSPPFSSDLPLSPFCTDQKTRHETRTHVSQLDKKKWGYGRGGGK